MNGNTARRRLLCGTAGLMTASLLALVEGVAAASVSGELRKWHKVTMTFEGPGTSEGAATNPFRDYRLDVTFSHAGSGKSYLVPGYYAADGDAAETSASSGSKWRCHFAPDETGQWTYSVSFRTGTDVAAADDPSTFPGAGYCHGDTGSFNISATDKSGRDFRGKGMLQYVGKHHLRFAETGEYFLKCGADAPENFLAYEDFDGDFKSDGIEDGRIKSWSPHAGDWNAGDPSWQGGKGTEIIGAINYLASEGMNVFSFLPMNIIGDDKNVFPYTSYSERYRFDCSKLDQWEIVFEHADHIGMYLHFKTQETENELLLDGGDLGVQRKLYYRELIARFSHHLALNWNLGEEINNASTAQKQAWAQYFWDNDPYQHNIVIHNGSNHYDLLGSASKLTGFSLQTNSADFGNVHSQVKNYIDRSDNAGKPWVVACDEPGDASHALRPDTDAGNSHVDGRKNGLWGCIMAGGAGLEWYFGYNHAHSDLTCEDWRSRDGFWDYCRYALAFFKDNNVPFWDMHCDDGLTSATDDYCLVKNDNTVFVIYLKSGGTTGLDLTGMAYDFTVKWFNPRTGGALISGGTVTGGGNVTIGPPPSDETQDWAALVELSGSVPTYALAVNDGQGGGSYLAGAQVQITADAKAGKIFDHWSGDTQYLASTTSSPTTVTMPAANISVTANYVDAPPGDTVLNFTLVNADTDADIRQLGDGDTINLATLPTRNLNVRANTSPTTVGSVRFGLDGNPSYRTESAAPYALEGDTGGDYNAWTPSVGVHTLTATPYSGAGATGTQGTALTITFTVKDEVATQDPFGGSPWPVPGRIEAEDFDEGGEGLAYHDTEAANQGDSDYRAGEGVDVQTCGDTGGGLNVGWVEAGEWLEYTVNVASAGDYDIEIRVAAQTGSRQLHVEFDEADVTGAVPVPNTGAWQTYQTARATGVTLSAGEQVMRVRADTAGFNVNWIDIVTASGADQLPVVGFTSPSGGDTVSGAVAVNATAYDPDVGTTDGDGIESVLFELIGATGVVGSHTESFAPYDWGFDAAAYPNGQYTLRATATSTSGAGGRSDSASITITIDNPLVDSDGDGMWDADELFYGLDPYDNDQDGNGVLDGDDDWNGNGVDNKTDIAGGNDPGDVPPSPSTTSTGAGCSARPRGASGPRVVNRNWALLLLLPVFVLLPRRPRAEPTHPSGRR